MYGVSKAYLAATRLPAQRHRATGTILTSDGIAHPFGNSDILSGSLTLTRQCSEGDQVKIGSVYAGELDVTITSAEAYRSLLDGATITLSSGLMLADGTWEDVPEGIFTVSSAEWSRSGVAIVAYDGMLRLDKAAGSITATGRAYQLLVAACEACGLVLGSTEAEVSAMPNGAEDLSLYTDGNDIETWRDYVSWLCQTLACFATMGRDGRLRLRRYGGTPVDAWDASMRWDGARFSDFVTRYTGLSVVEMANQSTTYYGMPTDDGLTYNLGSNPWLQKGLDATKTRRRRAILEALQDVAYVPFDVRGIGTPALDVGDCVSFTGGLAGASSLGCIMKSTWTLNGGIELQGFGSDPALATGNSKTDKNLSGLVSTVSASEVNYYEYVNAEPYEIGPKTQVAEVDFASKTDTMVEFEASVLLSSEGDVSSSAGTTTYSRTRVLATYELNGSTITTYLPVETYADGEHALVLYKPLAAKAGTGNVLKVYLAAEGGTIRIGAMGIDAVVSGKGLAADTSAWDGTEKLYGKVGLSLAHTTSSAYRAFSASASQAQAEPKGQALADAVDLSLAHAAPSAYRAFSATATRGYGSQTVNASRASNYSYDPSRVSITDGFRASEPASVTTDALGSDMTVAGISSFSASCSADVTFQLSPDGTTWYRRAGDGWAAASGEGDGSTARELSSAADFSAVFSGGTRLRFLLPATTSYLYDATLTYERT
jgi:hypothetical protein